MKYLKITNKGELDIRLVALMGGTTKANDKFKIGQFGTGLKYTLAFLYRNNLQFKIFAGKQEIKIALEREDIKGQLFEIICINGNRTSITTQMGMEWNAWMILRELWCNALDEGGAGRSYVYSDNLQDVQNEVKEGETTFYIQISNEIQAVLDNWEFYFLHGKEPIWENDEFGIYPGTGSLKLYKQGVLIHENKDKKALFNYDIKNATINELRQFIGSVSSQCVFALFAGGEKVVDYFLSNIREEHYEGSDIDYDWWKSFGDAWKKQIGTAKLIHPKAIENMEARGIPVDRADKVVVPKKVFDALTKQFEGISSLRVSKTLNEFYEIHSAELEERTKQALAILETCGYFVHPELKFVYGVFGDKTILAQINFDSKEIHVSEQLSNKSMFEFITMILEESEHFNTGHTDCSRQFQQHWINMYAKTLLEKNKITL